VHQKPVIRFRKTEA